MQYLSTLNTQAVFVFIALFICVVIGRTLMAEYKVQLRKLKKEEREAEIAHEYTMHQDGFEWAMIAEGDADEYRVMGWRKRIDSKTEER